VSVRIFGLFFSQTRFRVRFPYFIRRKEHEGWVKVVWKKTRMKEREEKEMNERGKELCKDRKAEGKRKERKRRKVMK